MNSAALAGRTVLLTGASGGIGAVTASELGSAGAYVIAQYRRRRVAAEQALAGVSADRVALVAGDLDTPGSARRIWHDAQRLRPVDVLVLNAAAMTDTPMDGSDEEWDAGWSAALQINVIGAGALLREAVRSFAARGSGTAIVLSSWSAEQGSRVRDASAYAASKAAIRNLAQTMARHYVRHGVRIYIVAPGVVSAGMGTAGQSDEQQGAVAAGLASGEHVDAGEVARLIAFLATDGCPSLTGATLDVNGASYIR